MLSFNIQNYINLTKDVELKQSSTSRWSTANDRDNLFSIDRKIKDYSVHTDFEKEPFIELKFKKSVSPDLILIENRARAPFDKLSNNLKIEVSDNGVDYKILHSGCLYFKHSSVGIPLIIPLYRAVTFQFLKLSLEGDDVKPLHLSKVLVLCESLPRLSEPINFVSDRTDGLGERIKALLNAMVLSKIYDSCFYFTWRPIGEKVSSFHSIEGVDEVFDYSFIRKHFKDEVFQDVKHYKHLGSTSDLTYVVDQNPVERSIFQFKNVAKREDYAEAFNKIGFSPKVKEALEIAGAVKLQGNSVSIHLRSGDIVNGIYRFGDRYSNKVLPVYIVNLIIKKCLVEDADIALVGQDSSVCGFFESRYNNVFLSNKVSDKYNFTTLQKAVFDIKFLSQAKQIVSGASGFAQLAALISCKDITPFYSFINVDSQDISSSLLFLQENISNFSSLEIAFSYWHMYQNFSNYLSQDQIVSILMKCVELDEENYFYKLVFVLLLANREENSAIVDDLCKQLMASKDKEYGIHYLSKYKYPDGSKVMKHYHAVIEHLRKENKNKFLTDLLKYF